jgi:hypothetical protein
MSSPICSPCGSAWSCATNSPRRRKASTTKQCSCWPGAKPTRGLAWSADRQPWSADRQQRGEHRHRGPGRVAGTRRDGLRDGPCDRRDRRDRSRGWRDSLRDRRNGLRHRRDSVDCGQPRLIILRTCRFLISQTSRPLLTCVGRCQHPTDPIYPFRGRIKHRTDRCERASRGVTGFRWRGIPRSWCGRCLSAGFSQRIERCQVVPAHLTKPGMRHRARFSNSLGADQIRSSRYALGGRRYPSFILNAGTDTRCSRSVIERGRAAAWGRTVADACRAGQHGPAGEQGSRGKTAGPTDEDRTTAGNPGGRSTVDHGDRRAR